MKSRLLEILEDCPIITAVKEERGLEQCLTLDNSIVFVLFGDVCSIPGIVRRAREAGKLVFVHIDLIAGLSGKEAAVDYIKAKYCCRWNSHHKAVHSKEGRGTGTLHGFEVLCH